MPYELTLLHLFAEKLNLYGDIGNVTALKKRAEWRGINLKVHTTEHVEDGMLRDSDIFFIGGGPDSLQALCTDELQKIKHELKEEIENGMPGLGICGGFQFLGTSYKTKNGEELDTLGILDFTTESHDPRFIGNILVESEQFGRIVGFENHGGRTRHNFGTLGKVVKGFGNCGEGEEGLHYKNLIGTYCHGPILPKNPAIADYLLLQALKRKYGEAAVLLPLDDEWENKANEKMWNRVMNTL